MSFFKAGYDNGETNSNRQEESNMLFIPRNVTAFLAVIRTRARGPPKSVNATTVFLTHTVRVAHIEFEYLHPRPINS